MKTVIFSSGLLRVIPETAIELYAATQWWKNWNQGNSSSSFEVFIDMDLDDPETTGDNDAT